MADAPTEVTAGAVMRPAPPAPWLSPEVHGQGIIMLAVCHSGSIADGERWVAPLKALGGAVGDIVQRRPYVTQQSLIDATQPKGRRYYWKSEYLPALSPDLLERVVPHARAIGSPHSAVILFPLGETLARLPADHSAVGNRDARWVLNLTASWERAEEDATHIEWARAAWRDLRTFSTGGTYVNFLTEEEASERIQSAYGPNLERLREVKRRWDPENRFRINKNITP